MFGIDIRSYPTFISTIMLHTCLCSCKGVSSSNMCTSSKHTYNPIWWNHMSPLSFPSTCWGWSPPFPWWFPSRDKSCFRLGGIYFYLGLFTMFFFNMVFELLQDCFVLDDSVNGFNFFFEVYGHIFWSHVPLLVLHLLSTSQLLTVEK